MESNKVIALGTPVLGEAEKDALISVINSGWLTMGERVKEFEKAFAKLHGLNDAVAVNSCTAGLHLCLTGLEIGAGDEVLVPSLTFVATANSVLYAGAKPVFVDVVSLTEPHMSIEDASKKLTDKTKAVMVMHYGGYVVDLPAWKAFASKHKLKLIEDAAHAPGASGVGILSDAAAFSFFTNKNMTTSEGGMVFANDPETLSRIRYQRSHGMTSSTLERQKGHAYSYDVISLGYNYRMDELRAAMGMVQLKKLPEFNKKRRELTAIYRKLLANELPSVIIPFSSESKTSAHLMTIILPVGANRESIMSFLRENKIQSSIHYPAVHMFSYYQKRFGEMSLPVTEEFCARELTLPLHPSLDEKDVKYVVQTLKKSIDMQPQKGTSW